MLGLFAAHSLRAVASESKQGAACFQTRIMEESLLCLFPCKGKERREWGGEGEESYL